MSNLLTIRPSEPRSGLKWLPQIGGLLAAGIVSSFACRLPLLHSLSPGEILGSAIACVLEVLSAAAVTVWLLCAIQPQTTALETRRLIQRTSIDALWLAPLALFIRDDSPWAMAMAAVLVASVVKSFRSLHNSSAATDGDESSSQNGVTLSLPQLPSRFWRQVSSAGAALCAQTAAFAALGGYPLTASLLAGASSAVWTWSFTHDSLPDNRHLSSPSSRKLLTVALAIIFTAASLMRYLPHTFWIRGHGIPSPNHAHQEFAPADRRAEPARAKAFEGSEFPDKGDLGIILTPDQLTHTKLVAPPPVMGNGLLTSHRITTPLVIPFDGVYWFFKAPDVRPPRRSRQAQGSPEMLDIHSTDRRPLSMEAHDHLGTLIELACCGRIQLTIRNADPYSETVSLELILVNSTLPGKPSQSLGRVMVKSKRTWNIDGQQPPTHETLNFAIPANPAIHRFDEVKVVFRLDAFRADDGAKIAIDRFVLVPRGL